MAGRAASNEDYIYKEIHDAILGQRLAPGERLAEDSLGEIFGVSRTIVRKVLQRLAHDHMVTIRPNKGASVAEPGVKEVRDIFVARRIIESGMMAQVADNWTAAHSQELRQMVQEEHDTALSGEREEWIRLIGDFHVRLAEISDNHIIREEVKQLVSRSALAVSCYQSFGAQTCSLPEHFTLLDLLDAGDRDAASAEMWQHLERSEEKLNLEAAKRDGSLQTAFAGIRPLKGRGQATKNGIAS